MSQSSSRPLPAYVYRRRRLAVFGGLALVLLLVLIVLPRLFGGGKQAAPAPTATQSANTGDQGAATPCDPNQIRVTAYTDADSYAAGVFPQFTVGVENTGTTACTLNVGSSKQVLTVTAEGDVPWISTDCQTDSKDYPLVLQPGAPVKSEPVQWDRTRSDPNTCAVDKREPVAAGGAAYQFTASVDGISATTPVTFVLN